MDLEAIPQAKYLPNPEILTIFPIDLNTKTSNYERIA